jgi:hypothetical protein
VGVATRVLRRLQIWSGRILLFAGRLKMKPKSVDAAAGRGAARLTCRPLGGGESGLPAARPGRVQAVLDPDPEPKTDDTPTLAETQVSQLQTIVLLVMENDLIKTKQKLQLTVADFAGLLSAAATELALTADAAPIEMWQGDAQAL